MKRWPMIVAVTVMVEPQAVKCVFSGLVGSHSLQFQFSRCGSRLGKTRSAGMCKLTFT
jgi:hypothetical protein